MPTKTLTVEKSYLKLLSGLKSVLVRGLKRIEEQRVKAYWQTGKLISKHLLENKNRAVYGDGLFERLSGDLNVNERILYQAVRFFEDYPNLNTCSELGWSHYRILISVQEDTRRSVLENRAISGNWTARELQEHIRLEGLRSRDIKKAKAPAQKLKVRRGRLYTYRLIRPGIINSAGAGLLVDCGFYFWRDLDLSKISEPAEGNVVESLKNGAQYSLKYSNVKRKQLYTYRALVERVVDADTIWAHIDLGFNSWSRQKIRFRGIDAPEISTQKGQRAKEFVEASLSKAKFIIVKTYSPDKYGRYLSDIFYLLGREGPQAVLSWGKFLNQELLNAGLAKVV